MIAQIALPWLLGALIGSMLFFAVTVAPTVFRALPAENGGKFLRRFFPQYYLWGIALGILCTLAALLTTNAMTTAVCAVVTLLFVYARQWLMPRINRARDRELDGDVTAARLFKRLHLQSVLVNGFQLLLLIAATLSPIWL